MSSSAISNASRELTFPLPLGIELKTFVNNDSTSSPCAVLLELRQELDALALALRKANEILALPADSPDTLRRRRNSIKRWNEIYGLAYERLSLHAREHQCAKDSLP